MREYQTYRVVLERDAFLCFRSRRDIFQLGVFRRWTQPRDLKKLLVSRDQSYVSAKSIQPQNSRRRCVLSGYLPLLRQQQVSVSEGLFLDVKLIHICSIDTTVPFPIF